MTGKLLVVGGGAAGMMAAIAAAERGAGVTLLERDPKVGRKLYITGKGRCNVTNHCTPQQVLESVPGNGRFLYGAMSRTSPADVEAFFTGLGVPLKVERGNRVFPQSDKAADIVDALFFRMNKAGCPRGPGPGRPPDDRGGTRIRRRGGAGDLSRGRRDPGHRGDVLSHHRLHRGRL